MSTVTATCDVVTGKISVDVPAAEDTDLAIIDGRTMFTLAEVEPWGAEEYGMDRADAALAGLGWRRVGEWLLDPGGQVHTCDVEADTR